VVTANALATSTFVAIFILASCTAANRRARSSPAA